VKTAYLDGELCGVDESGLPSFAHTQAATDGESGARLVYYAFDLLHLDGRDVSRLPLIERKKLLEPAHLASQETNHSGRRESYLGLKFSRLPNSVPLRSKLMTTPLRPLRRGVCLQGPQRQ
jgi:ATP-dependent DNA ligase